MNTHAIEAQYPFKRKTQVQLRFNEREGNHFEWDIVIPANTTAEVCLPTANGYEVKTYGSGEYHLSSEL